MFGKAKQDKHSKLEKEIEILENKMGEINDKTSKEYEDLVHMHEKLNEAEGKRKASKKWLISPDVLFMGGLQIAGILIVLFYEDTKIIVSKAWNMIPKGRL